jgi:hypothetical protein
VSSIEGLDELMDELDDLEEDIIDGLILGLSKGLKRTVEVAKEILKGNGDVDTGQLLNSITSFVERKGDTVDGQAVATAGHSIYVEMGTGPVGQANHQGVAPVPVTYRTAGTTRTLKNGKTYTLRGWVYYDKKTGQYRYTEGQPARPYMYPAYKVTRELIVNDAREAVQQKLRER